MCEQLEAGGRWFWEQFLCWPPSRVPTSVPTAALLTHHRPLAPAPCWLRFPPLPVYWICLIPDSLLQPWIPPPSGPSNAQTWDDLCQGPDGEVPLWLLGGWRVVISSFSFGLAGCCWLSSCAAFVSQAHNSEWYWFSSCAPGVLGPLSGEGDAGRWRSQPFNPLLMSSPLLLILFIQWGPALHLAWKGTSVARETERSLRKPKPQVKAHYIWPFTQRLGCAGNRTRCIFSNCLLQVGDLEPGCLDLFTWLHCLYAICVTSCKILVLLRPKLNGSSFTKWEG